MNYSKFKNLSEFLEDNNIKNMLVESKKECKKGKAEQQEEEVEAGEEKAKEGEPVKADKLEVIYSNHEQELRNIFKHIIVFTNDDDPKNNKTLKNIYDAVDQLKKAKCEIIPEVHAFVAADIEADEMEEEIVITDGDKKMVIHDESNTDTLIFARLGVQDEDQCEHIVKLLQDRGFLVLNPVQYSAVACDKYESAVLFGKGNIPQPNFTLMTKEILYDEKLYHEAMKSIYPKWDSKDPDKNEDFTFVVKILDGHGGTGVAMLDGKKILAVLQMIFAIDKDIRLIIQKKEEADGGDIRVHVLTLRDKQVILAAMKRVKLGGDFRSNVSLGATAEKVELTPEQEQIALKTAKLSKLPWCAVDIMPLVKGSNPEIGDNVVLEINASPGTDGISEVIEHNFVNILLNELDDPSQFMLQDKTAGFIESVTIDFGDDKKKELLAKLDTGNGAKASHIEVGDYEINDDKISFTIDGNSFEFDVKDYSHAKTGEQEHNRPIITIPELTLGLRKVKNLDMAIVKVREKSTNALINRDALSKLGYVVHPNLTHILTKEMEKVKIIN
jgi:glutathione synthase/RimK-type ligase-like ATP-grasp enzyme